MMINTKNHKTLNSLMFKLILSFFIPIILIIMLGVASYHMASSGIEDKYRDTAIQVVGMTADYIGFGLETVVNTSHEYISDKNISQYFTYSYLDATSEMFQIMSTIQNDFLVKSTIDGFILNVYVIPENDKVISSNPSMRLEEGTYDGIFNTDIGKQLSDIDTNLIWSGSDTYIDEKLGTDSSEYALRLIRKFQNNQALIIIDIKVDAIKEIIENTNLDETGILAFVTKDGKEIAEGNNNEILFSNQSFYKSALENENVQGTEYVSISGKSYLFMYSKVGETGAMICALIPQSTITGQAVNIRNVTINIVIMACIIAVFTGVIISTGIDKTIKGIISGLRNTAAGNLTVEFNTKRNDEFKTLIEEIRKTFSNMKALIKQVNILGNEVAESSSDLNRTSSTFLNNTENISRAISEIEQGLVQQTKDAEECLMQMDILSKKIIQVNDNTKEIGRIAEDTKKSIAEGTSCTNELSQQTESTIEITTTIINAIEILAKKSVVITQIINVINEIANQTNLLALNASIEAARAGEYGRGFSVVANEIRGLAEKSQQSVSEIKNVISSIWNDTRVAVETAKKAETVLDRQENAVKSTIESYNKINESVEKLIIFLNHISENVENIEESRVSTLGAIENICAVLEEIAASSNSVGQATTEQLSSVEALNQSAMTLKENAKELSQAIGKFIV